MVSGAHSTIRSTLPKRAGLTNRIRRYRELYKCGREVSDRLAEGTSYQEIADAFSLSIDTVRMHIKGIYSKLHVHSRGEAVAKYLRK